MMSITMRQWKRFEGWCLRHLLGVTAILLPLLICVVSGGQAIKGGVGVKVTVGPFVTTATGYTISTALTLAQGDVWLSKNGAAAATKNQADSCGHLKHGFYACSLNSTDTDTDGTLDILIKESGYLIVWRHLMVMDGTVYDADITGTDNRQVDMV